MGGIKFYDKTDGGVAIDEVKGGSCFSSWNLTAWSSVNYSKMEITRKIKI
jgi:hypothetical protein